MISRYVPFLSDLQAWATGQGDAAMTAALFALGLALMALAFTVSPGVKAFLIGWVIFP